MAKLAKLATLPAHLLTAIAARGNWVRNERIRNALLGNFRLPQAIVQKIVSTLTKQEVRGLLQRRDLPQAVQAAVRQQAARLSS